MVLAVNPTVPVSSVKQLIAYAKANSGKLNFASNGNGSSSQLAAVIFNSMAGTDMVHVPYKGLSPALVDLVSAKVDLMFSSVVAIMPQVQAGKLKALGVTSPKRLAGYPQIPTIAEQGLAGYESGSWYGILAPAHTPEAVVARLNAEINKAIQDPAVASKLAEDGAEAVGGPPQVFADQIASELKRLKRFAKDIKVD
jgi:tripartite-type tricarboxylate transporter receptor subunit TctC